MARKDSRNLLNGSTPEDPQDRQLINPPTSENETRFSQQTIQVLVEKHNPEDIKDLMKMENEVFRKRLEIIREHAEQHPDAKEERRTKRETIRFRRFQYLCLSGILIVLLASIPIVSIEIAAIFGIVIFMIVGGILLNARDRDFDIKSFTDMINTILRRGK